MSWNRWSSTSSKSTKHPGKNRPVIIITSTQRRTFPIRSWTLQFPHIAFPAPNDEKKSSGPFPGHNKIA